MTLWITFAVLTALGLWAVLRPLMATRAVSVDSPNTSMAVYRDQLLELEREFDAGIIAAREVDAARAEISRRLLSAAGQSDTSAHDTGSKSNNVPRLAALATCIGVPVIGLSIYLTAGSPNLPGQPHADRLTQSLANQNITSLISRAEAHLRQRPDDVRGWQVLAPAYRRLRRYVDAAYALEQLLRLEGRKPALLAEYGEALVFGEGGLVSKKAMGIFMEAQRLDNKLVKPRYYLALASAQDGNLDKAVAGWQAMLSTAPARADWRRQVEQAIKTTKRRLAAGKTTASARAPALDKNTVAAVQNMAPAQQQAMILSMVKRLATRLERDGNDLNGWLRLARAYAVLKKPDALSDALAKARKRFAGDEKALGKINQMAKTLKQMM